MSTKCSIAYGDGTPEDGDPALYDYQKDFHFYYECFDHQFVYLRMPIPPGELNFSIEDNQITVHIPNEVMDKIAQAWIEERIGENDGNTESPFK